MRSLIERWKTISGFSDYEISSFGRVKRIRHNGNNASAERILRFKGWLNGRFHVRLYRYGRTGCFLYSSFSVRSIC